MWKFKKFKTHDALEYFVSTHNIQWHEVFINNGYAIEYRYLKVIKV